MSASVIGLIREIMERGLRIEIDLSLKPGTGPDGPDHTTDEWHQSSCMDCGWVSEPRETHEAALRSLKAHRNHCPERSRNDYPDWVQEMTSDSDG